jgi:hypothetical protein
MGPRRLSIFWICRSLVAQWRSRTRVSAVDGAAGNALAVTLGGRYAGVGRRVVCVALANVLFRQRTPTRCIYAQVAGTQSLRFRLSVCVSVRCPHSASCGGSHRDSWLGPRRSAL